MSYTEFFYAEEGCRGDLWNVFGEMHVLHFATADFERDVNFAELVT